MIFGELWVRRFRSEVGVMLAEGVIWSVEGRCSSSGGVFVSPFRNGETRQHERMVGLDNTHPHSASTPPNAPSFGLLTPTVKLKLQAAACQTHSLPQAFYVSSYCRRLQGCINQTH